MSMCNVSICRTAEYVYCIDKYSKNEDKMKTKGSFQKKKLRNIWKIPYLRVVSGGHFPYVITEDLKCIESHFEHF